MSCARRAGNTNLVLVSESRQKRLVLSASVLLKIKFKPILAELVPTDYRKHQCSVMRQLSWVNYSTV